MNAMSRPLATLAAAAVGGAGLWLAGHWDTNGNGGYWAMLGVLALVGLLLGVSQLHATDANAPGMLLVAWLPITIVAGWVLVSAQPDPNTFRAKTGSSVSIGMPKNAVVTPSTISAMMLRSFCT